MLLRDRNRQRIQIIHTGNHGTINYLNIFKKSNDNFIHMLVIEGNSIQSILLFSKWMSVVSK